MSWQTKGIRAVALTFAALSAAFFVGPHIRADITVDPDGVGATDVVLDPGGMPSLLSNPVPDPLDLGETLLAVGNTGDGSLSITNGGQLTTVGTLLGNELGSAGTMIVDGVGTAWTMEGDNLPYLIVGSQGRGELQVTGGAQVTGAEVAYLGEEPGSQGIVTIRGSGSVLSVLLQEGLDFVPDEPFSHFIGVYVGYGGTGLINVLEGGHLITTSTVVGLAGESGVVNIDGVGSTWTVRGGLYGYPNGSVNVTSGGYLSSEVADIGDSLFDTVSRATVDGPGSAWDVDWQFSVGRSGSGELTIGNGGRVTSREASVGGRRGGNGIATVEGAGSSWQNSGDFDIGAEGTATLVVRDGGAVSNKKGTIGRDANEVGAVAVDGPGSGWLNHGPLTVGHAGAGTLTVRNGGTVSSSWIYEDGELELQSGVIGRLAGSTGAVVIDGGGSTWNNREELYVGQEGAGTLAILNGDAVRTRNVFIGETNGATGEVTVDGGGSLLSCDTVLRVALHGAGKLEIRNAGAAYSDDAAIGILEDATGEAFVDGVGSIWNSRSTLSVGRSGNGNLTITNGGVVTDRSGIVGEFADSTGKVTVDGVGSTWSNRASLRVGFSDAATLEIRNGGLVTAGTDGRIEATLAFGIGVDGPGLLQVDETLTIGDATTLAVTFDQGIEPTSGEEFLVVTAGEAIDGTFGVELLPPVVGDVVVDWAVHYNPADITLEVLSSQLAGDFDHNGAVNGDDFMAWQDGFGISSGATHSQGDADADGDVDGVDFLRWQSQFGIMAGSRTVQGMANPTQAEGLQAVPEPAASMLAWVLLVVASASSRRI